MLYIYILINNYRNKNINNIISTLPENYFKNMSMEQIPIFNYSESNLDKLIDEINNLQNEINNNQLKSMNLAESINNLNSKLTNQSDIIARLYSDIDKLRSDALSVPTFTFLQNISI
jgi:predicted RNase H-like nuclease (RuvC/YqgF family)